MEAKRSLALHELNARPLDDMVLRGKYLLQIPGPPESLPGEKWSIHSAVKQLGSALKLLN
jgi:hypothetical protein